MKSVRTKMRLRVKWLAEVPIFNRKQRTQCLAIKCKLTQRALQHFYCNLSPVLRTGSNKHLKPDRLPSALAMRKYRLLEKRQPGG